MSGLKGGFRRFPVYRGESVSQELEDSLFATPAGQFGGPVWAGTAWVFYLILEKVPEFERDFEEALKFVEGDYQSHQEELIMKSFLARLRERIPVVVYPERLAGLVGDVDS
jgi:hypothetical protein